MDKETIDELKPQSYIDSDLRSIALVIDGKISMRKQYKTIVPSQRYNKVTS